MDSRCCPKNDCEKKKERTQALKTDGTTHRYEGGAKERAVERRDAGEKLTTTDEAVLNGQACAWCAGALPHCKGSTIATYCSHVCAEEGRLKRGGFYASTRVREQVFDMEGGVCQKCGLDAHALFRRIEALHPSERLSVLCDLNWNLPRARVSLERLLQDPKEGDFWQADHIIPVAEGGGSCDLDNLRTLCTPCHKEETQKLQARLKLGTNQDSKRKQMDIRTAFFGLPSAKKTKTS